MFANAWIIDSEYYTYNNLSVNLVLAMKLGVVVSYNDFMLVSNIIAYEFGCGVVEQKHYG
jgi:hypothetical protein